MVTQHNYINKRQSHSHTQIQTNKGFPYQYLYYFHKTSLRKCFMLCNDVVANRKRDLSEVIQRELVSGFRYIYNELWEETLKERRI